MANKIVKYVRNRLNRDRELPREFGDMTEQYLKIISPYFWKF